LAYSVIHSDEIDPAGPGGMVRFVRRGLGVEAFGINRFDLPAGAGGIEHDEASTGQEEVAFVFAGDGHWLVDGEQVPVRAGSFIRFDAGSVRRPMAGADGLSFVVVGCPPGGYKPHGPF
jgi:quercetin dioxygenase-like cupin family protein